MRGRFLYKKLFFSILLVCVCFHTFSAWAEIELIERPDNEFLILGLTVNGEERSEGIEAFLPDSAPPENILIPLGTLSRSLSLGIETDPALGTAEGFYIDEENAVNVDLEKDIFEVGSKSINITKEMVEPHADDLYVQIGVLEEILDLDINFDPSSLNLTIQSDEPLPFQAADKRKERAARLLTKQVRNDFDPEKAFLLPYKNFSRPTMTLQQSLSGVSADGDRNLIATSNAQASFDFLKFGSNFNITYSANNDELSEIRAARLQFSRSDPLREMLGPLNTGRVDVGDITFPSVPLFIGNSQGAGVAISSDTNFGFRLSQQLGNVLIDGDAPVGWDAELYRNGQFIDFQQIENEARFSFDNVQLINGFNRFQILLFGPQGEKETITRDIFSGPNMLSEGVVKYDAAIGMPESAFLPLAENRQDNTALGASGKIFYGFTNYLTVGASAYTGPVNGEAQSTAAVSAVTTFKGFNLQLQQLAASEGRSASEASLRRRFLGTNVALTHTRFQNFEEDDQDIESSTELSLSRSFGRLNLTLIGDHQKYLDEEDRTIIQSILSSRLFGFRFTNNLTKTIAENENIDDLEGELSVFTDVIDTRLRSSLTYDLDNDIDDRLKVFRLSAQRRLTDTNTLRLGMNYDFPTNIYSVDARYTHQFDPVAVDFDIGANNDNNYFAGIALRVGLQPEQDGYKFVKPSLSTLAQLGIRAYIDENGNGIYDPNEKLIPNVGFEATNSNSKTKSNENGIAQLRGLSETPTRVSLIQADIPSIYIQPVSSKIDLIPRVGSENIIDFAFIQLGEIDGFVQHAQTGEGLANIPVRLIDNKTGEEIATMNTESDGFFIFSAIPTGDYKVIASQAWFEEGKPDTDSLNIDVTTKEPIKIDNILKIIPDENLLTNSVPMEDLLADMPENMDFADNLENNLQNQTDINDSEGIIDRSKEVANDLAKKIFCGKNCKR